MTPFEYLLLGVSLLLLVSILASKVSSRLGVPALLLFLLVGMLAGSDGPGGFQFDNPVLVQSLGIVALAYILFAGGLDTNWRSVRPVLGRALILSTLGVFVTALLVGWFVHAVLDFSLLEGLLVGAIVSSTDAAAVFSVLRSRNVSLSGELKPLLELESGSNDPMAVFLTVAIISLLVDPGAKLYHLPLLVLWQMVVGGAAGYLLGKGGVLLINRLRLEYEGLYSVLTLTLVLLIYSGTVLLKGNGFLAVYAAGLVMGNSSFVQKKSLVRFHDGLAWLMQITMFLILGLQVFPSHLVPVTLVGLCTAAFLMLVARPVSVFATLLFTPMTVREKTMISWVGLRGAVPIVLATFPLMAGVGKAEMIFNVVFFIVCSSALLQGSTIPLAARWLGLDAPMLAKRRRPFEFEASDEGKGELVEIEISPVSLAVNRQIVDLHLPAGSLIVLIQRRGEFVVPGGGTLIEAGDTVHLLADRERIDEIRAMFETPS
ncbi:potassium/proton antiporter [Geobacter sulfurreducens]|jgi:cell volume regulation protein A|uniref:Potassium/proton antiporter, putative n=1 Tax=Geobacter sulfurreducens (strain ATCC 51573 / DSM 12127 / PCA) TaxID=243231 RepID=Q74DW2_GEOSL|nr:potassium/proton antiporter [Geobacter sulfurreducens]AAR34579.1 potassium/proton antiporter, putative [Geobacter sulfurreducens PCA]ADI84038.2 potassium/proton antiporter, putative [Geobacter sulfurreducens KN400]AJY70915.1 potassium transporter [Geobacter sulfurreducens]QVW36421.1 potassium/proton antiporter [Geobacter sulfurreducens]UAC05234.1 potassium/proton antiporter [Geobacter sulfurreducens]